MEQLKISKVSAGKLEPLLSQVSSPPHNTNAYLGDNFIKKSVRKGIENIRFIYRTGQDLVKQRKYLINENSNENEYNLMLEAIMVGYSESKFEVNPFKSIVDIIDEYQNLRKPIESRTKHKFETSKTTLQLTSLYLYV